MWRLRRAWGHVMCVTWMLFPSRLWRRRPSTLLMVAVPPPITSMVPGVFLQQKHTYTYSFRVYMHSCVFTDANTSEEGRAMWLYVPWIIYVCIKTALSFQKYHTSPNEEDHVIKGCNASLVGYICQTTSVILVFSCTLLYYLSIFWNGFYLLDFQGSF